MQTDPKGLPFRLDFQVRDYECDLQGVVNNSVYQNYLEHTRHEFLKSLGLDFAQLTKEKIYLVVVRAELEYRTPLMSGDKFWVGLRCERASKLRLIFYQSIYRYPDDQLMLKARITGTALDENRRPSPLPEELKQYF